MADEPHRSTASAARVWELARVFLYLGGIGYGGPAAHAALMRRELVQRRGWLSDQELLDLLAAAAVIPGPNSTELAIHIGYRRAGWPGLVVAGTCFIVPAMAIVTLAAWAYVTYGALPAVAGLMYGVKPVIVGITGWALWGLLGSTSRGRLRAAITVGSTLLSLYGVDELVILAVGLAVGAGAAWRPTALRGRSLTAITVGTWPWVVGGAATGAVAYSHLTLFLTFAKIGSVLYGSGYVLLAYLRTDFVDHLGWLTEAQLLDAVAVGQFTPGPVFTTATFVGYVVGGLPGALIATAGIFLPAFVFVAITAPIVDRLRQWKWMVGPLNGVNAAAVGLLAAVIVLLARVTLFAADWTRPEPAAWIILVLTLVGLWHGRINSAWLVLGGGLAGVALRLAGLV